VIDDITASTSGRAFGTTSSFWAEDRLTEILRDGRPRVHLEGLSLALIELYRRAVDAIR